MSSSEFIAPINFAIFSAEEQKNTVEEQLTIRLDAQKAVETGVQEIEKLYEERTRDLAALEASIQETKQQILSAKSSAEQKMSEYNNLMISSTSLVRDTERKIVYLEQQASANPHQAAFFQGQIYELSKRLDSVIKRQVDSPLSFLKDVFTKEQEAEMLTHRMVQLQRIVNQNRNFRIKDPVIMKRRAILEKNVATLRSFTPEYIATLQKRNAELDIELDALKVIRGMVTNIE